MSRSNYSHDCEHWALICWRGAVAKATNGKRGQKLLKDLLAALDAMPNKRLIAHELIQYSEVCTLGALGVARGMGEQLATLDPYEADDVASAFGVAPALVREIEYMNDYYIESPEQRWTRMREWVASQILA